jgi:MFS family permease
MVGTHLMNLYISLLLTVQGHTQQHVSFINSLGFLGLGLSGFYTDRMIHRWGLISSFVFCCVISSILACLFFFYADSYLTMASLRLFLGLIVGFMYVITATWLVRISPKSQRSTNLAYYMLVLYSAQSVSPFLLLLPTVYYNQAFICAGLFTGMSIIPALWININHKEKTNESKAVLISLLAVLKKSPIGLISSIGPTI